MDDSKPRPTTQSGRGTWAIGVTGALAGFGTGFGLLLLALNGYVEDSGTPEAHTLPFAIPLLAVSGALVGFAIRAALSRERSERRRALGAVIVGGTLGFALFFAILLGSVARVF